jgi:hypothetical protein
MRENPRPQEVYRHFKGNIYQILTLAYDSETLSRMVVYQQLYAPYEAYVRPLEMFMSKVDTAKYPDAKQKYRFEKIDVNNVNNTNIANGQAKHEAKHEAKSEVKPEGLNTENKEDATAGEQLDSGLMEFLDADSYEKKLQILSSLHPRITDDMINTMAVSLDTEVNEGDIETRYNEIKKCLLTMERFECNRLR